MNQENKQLILAGPYKLDSSAHNIVSIRGEGQAVIGKFAPGIYNRKNTTQVSYKQAEVHAALMLEALQVFALTGKTPTEIHIALTKIYA
jgi:hypothetical protein